MSRHTVLAASILSVALMGAALTAGPLSPPVGPVASSYKTLSEVEPRTAVNSTNTPGDASCVFKITQPGSYYLTGNLTGQAAKHTIAIAAAGVTLDLAGFRITGIANSQDGVNIAANLTNVTIKNGSIIGQGSDGIDGNTADNVRVERITVRTCGQNGIACRTDAVVTDCTVISCDLFGIVLGNRSTVRGCTATNNVADGFNVTLDGVIDSCSAHNNGDDGFNGNGAYKGCVATGNGANGFNGGGAFDNCRADINTADGFSCWSGSSVVGCSSSNNGDEGFAGSGAAFTGCTATGNTGDGFEVQSSRMADCNAYGNDQHGYLLTTSQVTGCRSFSNGIVGGVSGFYLLNGNRLDGNSCSGSGGNGYVVAGNSNSLTRNFAAQNSGAEYNVAAGNWVAPINNTAAAGPLDNIQQ